MKWFTVERIEQMGGGKYGTLFVIEARDVTEALKIGFEQPSKELSGGGQITRIGLAEKAYDEVTVVPYAKEENPSS